MKLIYTFMLKTSAMCFKFNCKKLTVLHNKICYNILNIVADYYQQKVILKCLKLLFFGIENKRYIYVYLT